MTRRYIQRERAESAARTRRRVLDAARDALLRDGALEFGVGDIAAAAGVARSTIYDGFGSRAGLLAALADETLRRAGLDDVIAEYRRPDAVEALEGSLRANCRMYAADHRIFMRLLMLRELDPSGTEPIARSQADRATGMGDLALRLAEQHRLRDGVTIEHATNVLWLVTSFWTFDELHSGRGLDAMTCADTLVGLVRSTLLAGDGAIDPPTAGT